MQACLPCGHTFGLHCIQSWLREKDHQLCPRCRTACKAKQAVVLYSDQNEVIERLQAELKRQQERLAHFETAQNNAPPALPSPPLVAPPPPNNASTMDISETETKPVAPAPPPRVAPAYFGLTNHSLPHFDAQFLDCFPSLDLLIVNGSRNITSSPQSKMVHPKSHGKVGRDSNHPFGVTLYQNWTHPKQFVAYYIPLSNHAITDLKVYSKGQGSYAKHFFLVSTSIGDILVAELRMVPNGLEADIIVEISLGNARNPITALEWDVANHDIIYAAISAKIVRMDLSKPKDTASWITLTDYDTSNDNTFKIISVPPTSDLTSNLIVGSSSGIYTVDWSYDNQVRTVDLQTVSDEKVYHVLQPHPLHPHVVLAGCRNTLDGTREVEQHYFSLTLCDPKPEEYDLSPRLLLYRRVNDDVPQSLNLTTSACLFISQSKDYILAVEPLEAHEIESISNAPAASQDIKGSANHIKKVKVPMITSDHLTRLQKVRHWRAFGSGEFLVIAAIDATHIHFLMPY